MTEKLINREGCGTCKACLSYRLSWYRTLNQIRALPER